MQNCYSRFSNDHPGIMCALFEVAVHYDGRMNTQRRALLGASLLAHCNGQLANSPPHTTDRYRVFIEWNQRHMIRPLEACAIRVNAAA